MNNRTGVSIVSLPDAKAASEFFEVWFKKYGRYPSFELSYKMDQKFLDSSSSIKGRVLSGHAPCPGGEYLPNLGSRNAGVVGDSLDSIARSADTVAAFGGDILVLHAGYTLDSPVYTEFAKRKKVLEEYEKNSSFLLYREGSICKPDFCRSDEYRIHMDETLKNLKEASDICSDRGIKLAVENLNPRLTYLFQMPEDFIRLTQEIGHISICVDIGHLWISSLIHGFDYFKALELLVKTGRVVSAHIHDNRSVSGDNRRYSDDHETIGSGTVPVSGSISLLAKHSTANLIVETSTDPELNLKILEDMTGSEV